MGAVSFSIDVGMIRFFKRFLPLAVFIETGTMNGDTVAAVRPYFARTVSIELSEEYQRAAAERFRDDPDVEILQGDSAALLGRLAGEVDNISAMFWLDAHWCRDDERETGGAASQCPLLAEIAALGRLNAESVLLIDDARLFLCTPGRPHAFRQWPDFHDIVAALLKLSPVHRTMVVNDVIVLYPARLLEPFQRYVHENGVDWLDIINTCRDWPRLSREHERLKEAHGNLARTHQETVRELQALQEVHAAAERRHEAERQAAAAREASFGRIEQEFERSLALMAASLAQKDENIAQLQAIAEMRAATVAERDQVIQRLERRRLFKRAALWAASITRKGASR
jgi:hypothetical protein